MVPGNVRAELMRHMNVLCREIGERHLGSTGEAEAADYVEAQFESAGYAVERQTFDAPGWRYGAYHLRTDSGGREFSCFPCFYSNAGRACGKPVFLDLDHQTGPIAPERVKDKIVLAYGSFDSVSRTNALAEDLDWAGAKALIQTSPYQDTFSTKIVRHPGLKRLVVLTVSKNTALEIARELEDDRLGLEVEAENFHYETCNLVARSESAREKEHKVVIGAHYDTAPGIPGAGDDASGTAILLVLARIMKDVFHDAPFDVELAAFTGEEYGGVDGSGLGAVQFAAREPMNGDKMRWMADIDDVGTYLGRLQPVVFPGRNLYRLLNSRLAKWNLNAEYRRVGGCDVGPFNRLGIPTVFFNEAKPPNGNAHFPLHSPMDNLDLIDENKLVQNVEIVGSCLEAMLAAG